MANVWLNNISDKLISKERVGSNGKSFFSILFPCDAIGGNLASVTVSKNQRFTATRRNGTVLDGFSCILLGSPETMRTVSFRDEQGEFQRISISVQQIFDSFEQNRADYRATRQQAEASAKAEQTSKKGGRKATKALQTV